MSEIYYKVVRACDGGSLGSIYMIGRMRVHYAIGKETFPAIDGSGIFVFRTLDTAKRYRRELVPTFRINQIHIYTCVGQELGVSLGVIPDFMNTFEYFSNFWEIVASGRIDDDWLEANYYDTVNMQKDAVLLKTVTLLEEVPCP